MKKRKGVSPVIATVLLIALVITIALIVFLWLRKTVEDKIVKFGDEAIELTCDKVKFDVEYLNSNNIIVVENNGEIPIKDFLVKKIGVGVTDSFKLSEQSDGFNGITTGQNREINIDSSENINNYNELRIIPILLGKSNSGVDKEFTCDDRNGLGVELS